MRGNTAQVHTARSQGTPACRRRNDRAQEAEATRKRCFCKETRRHCTGGATALDRGNMSTQTDAAAHFVSARHNTAQYRKTLSPNRHSCGASLRARRPRRCVRPTVSFATTHACCAAGVSVRLQRLESWVPRVPLSSRLTQRRADNAQWRTQQHVPDDQVRDSGRTRGARWRRRAKLER